MAKDESARVEFKLRCNETAIIPEITFEKSFIGIEGSPDEYIFHVQTRNVCLRPTVTCEASYFRSYLFLSKLDDILWFFFNFQVIDDKSSENGMIYDLSSLKTSSEEWTVDVGSKTFRLAVCKTLNPSSSHYLCPNTNSSVCSIDNEVIVLN